MLFFTWCSKVFFSLSFFLEFTNFTRIYIGIYCYGSKLTVKWHVISICSLFLISRIFVSWIIVLSVYSVCWVWFYSSRILIIYVLETFRSICSICHFLKCFFLLLFLFQLVQFYFFLTSTFFAFDLFISILWFCLYVLKWAFLAMFLLYEGFGHFHMMILKWGRKGKKWLVVVSGQ